MARANGGSFERLEWTATFPDGAEIAEEVLVLQTINENSPYPYETIYVRRSSLVPDGSTVLSHIDLMTLVSLLRRIQAHFQQRYDRADDPSFAMDVEFKVDSNRQLTIKQARPWLR